MTQLFRRASCPACYRRGRAAVTVGWIVEGAGLFALTRLPEGHRREPWEEAVLESVPPTENAGLYYDQGVDGPPSLLPPRWKNSARAPLKVPPTKERTVRCRYGHELRVPSKGELDRMLRAREVRDDDLIYLPVVR